MSDKRERKIGPEDAVHAYRLARNLELTNRKQLLAELATSGYSKEEALEVVKQLAGMLDKHRGL